MRLFVGVRPPEAALARVAAAVEAVRDLPTAPSWTDPRTWHLTLAFLGEVHEAHLPRLTAALAEAAAADAAPTIWLAGSGTFPGRGPPAVLWVGVDGDLDGLEGLARAVRRACRSARAPAEGKGFSPHLTVGRWRRPGIRAGADLLDLPPGPPFAVAEIELIRSYLGSNARHESVARIALGR